MKHLGSHISIAIAATSLLLSAATVMLWVRSYSITDSLFYVYKGEGYEQVSSMRGKVMVLHVRPVEGVRGGFRHASHRAERINLLAPPLWSDEPRERRWLFFGFFNQPPPSPQMLQGATAATMALNEWNAMNVSQKEYMIKFRFDTLDKTDRLVAGWPAQGIKNRLVEEYADELESTARDARRLVAPIMKSYFELVIPLWMLFLLTLIPSAMQLASARHRRNLRRRGCCTVCGYDLRATPDRCPECGTVPMKGRA